MNETLAYVMGVLFGDGYVTSYRGNHQVCLTTTSRPFAESFTNALQAIDVHARIMGPYHFTGKYWKNGDVSPSDCLRVVGYAKWLVMLKKGLRVSDLFQFVVRPASRLAWLRGFYESEGYDRGRGRGLLLYK